MAVSARNGWGMQTAFNPVTSSVAGPINTVLGNVGVAVSIVASGAPMRLSKIFWRVDLAPDVPAGTVNVPVRWRLLVMAGQLPQDVTAFQRQAYAGGAHPEIPDQTSGETPNPLLWDEWLDFAAGDPGLNQIAERDFADAGPGVAQGEFMSVLLTPIIDANIPQILLGVANASMVLGAYGLGVASGAAASGGIGGSGGSRSMPRFDVALNGGG